MAILVGGIWLLLYYADYLQCLLETYMLALGYR